MATEQTSATQEFVPIKEVRDGIVLLKDGGLRAILLTSSINFALKSQDEQNSVIFQFQNFLNSLDFPVEIFIQSRKLDIRPYIALLEDRYRDQVNDLLKIQTREYIEFIKSFTESANIMTKSFFIIVPYNPASLTAESVGGFFSKKKDEDKTKDAAARYEENRSQLEQRIAVIEQGLIRTGVRVVQLGTEEIIELYYKIFNPGEQDKPIKLP
jgi:type IV secretory pathway VirB4 component